jgi:hypothetical protein
MYNSILQRIWLNFMTLYHSFTVTHFYFGFPTFFGVSITEENLIVEMRIWCIKICNVLHVVLHLYIPSNDITSGNAIKCDEHEHFGGFVVIVQCLGTATFVCN